MADPSRISTGTASLRYELQRCCATDACTIVLVHEMGGMLQSWDDVVPRVAAHSNVLRYDLRGAGLSEKLIGTPILAIMSAALIRLLGALAISGPLLLAGVAVGAAIALHAARTLAPRMSGLTLLSASQQSARTKSWREPTACLAAMRPEVPLRLN